MLSKLGKRPASALTPFDMTRSTLDGIIDLTASGFQPGKYLPHPAPLPRRYIPDPVSIWLLFRSHHVCFTHFDLNHEEAIPLLAHRIQFWDALVSQQMVQLAPILVTLGVPEGKRKAYGSPPPSLFPLPSHVTFLRTVTAEHPEEEIEAIPQLHRLLRERSGGRLRFRTVLVMHNQGPATAPLCCIPSEANEFGTPCVIWNLRRAACGARASLLDECHDGYKTIIEAMSGDGGWEHAHALPSYAEYAARRMESRGGEETPQRAFRPYTELSLVCGVPAVRGTCAGFGSTRSAVSPDDPCPLCGSSDGHSASSQKTRFDSGKPWTPEALLELVNTLMSCDGDEVLAVEKFALEQQRGAHETWLKVRELMGDA